MPALAEAPVTGERVLAPQAPATLEEVGLPAERISALVIKWLDRGEASGTQLARSLCLRYSLIEPLIEHLRTQQLIEVKRAAGVGTAGYRYALTDTGRPLPTNVLSNRWHSAPSGLEISTRW